MTPIYSLNDCVRMVGQLLLHRPTTGTQARNNTGQPVSPYHGEASCFCFVGATNAVSWVLGHHMDGLWGKCNKALGEDVEGMVWDDATDQQRAAWAKKLSEVTEP